MKTVIKQPIITAGFGLALCLISAGTVLSSWCLIAGGSIASKANLLLIVAIANNFSLLLLGWVYSRLWRWFSSSQPAKQDGKVQQATSERFFNLSLDMLMVGNINGYFTELNPAWERTLGFTLEELKAQPFISLVHPEDVAATQAEMEKLGAGICVTRFENRYRCKNGSYKWLSWTAVPFLEDGLIYGVARDITDEKQAEETLQKVNQELESAIAERLTQLMQAYEDLLAEVVGRRQVELALRQSEALYRTSEQRFRVALQNSPTIVFNQDTELRYTWVYNANAESYAQQMIGKTDAELLSPEEAERLTVIKQQVLTTGVGTREETCSTINGEVRYYDLTVEPLLGLVGEVVGITCAATDITEIRVREQQLRAIFEGSLDAIAIADDQGIYIEANPAACQLFGLPLSELLGRRVVDFMKPGFDFEKVWRSFREYGQFTGEGHLVRPDGTLRNVDYAAKANFLPGRHLSIMRDITQRQQAEAALRESQHLLQQIADTIPSQLYIYDLIQEGHIYANRRMQEFHGCTQAELRAMNWQFFVEHIHPDDFYQIMEGQEQFVRAEDGEVLEKEFRMKNARGEWRWLHTWEVVFTRTAEGQPEKILGTAIDITGRKQTEEALRMSEQQLRTALEAAHMGTWNWNILTGKIAWSENFYHFLGIGTNDFDGNYESFIERIHPEDRDRVLQKVKRVLQAGENYEDEFRIILPNGNVRWLASIGHTSYDEAGRPVRMTGLDLDISDRKNVELALLEERNCISAILETANALIVVLDEQGKFIRFNRACEQITGYSLAEVQGKCIWDLFLIPEEVETVQAIIQELQSGQFPNETETYWIVRDGSHHLISWFNTVILDSDSLVKQIISIGIDITDRKRAEDMRRELEREQALSELRLRFFSMASHEFRTPLSTILLTAQILESSAHRWSQDKLQRNLQRIVLAAKEMRQMLDDILTINRAETGRLEFTPTQIELNAFCNKILQDNRANASPHHTLLFSSQSEYEWALIDGKLLGYILNNLILNSIKYSPNGGSINLELNRNQDSILFKVYDQGIGIPLVDQPHLFEAFHRGENVNSIPGSGLGLTVAKKCAELHGGRITFTSEIGAGATFTVIIPT